jgi:DNA-nicking Smr family endonuclease
MFDAAHNMTQDRSQHVIDIHGLKVTEARSHVEKALRDAIVAGAPRLRVITGRGNHSVGNIPVLKTRIIEAMAEYHIPTRVHPTNPGELWIELAPGVAGTPS